MGSSRILVVVGTRPEAIKMAPLIRSLRNRNDFFDCRVCVTAQHRQMLDQVLKLFDIKTDYDLDLMRAGQELCDISAGILLGMRKVLRDFKPNRVLVHGDTTTTMIAALAAFYEKIPLAHVEAGLRTGNVYAPWPEEFNRKVATVIADLHFAPTQRARANLLKENVPEGRIFVTGNTVVDALLTVVKEIEKFGPTKAYLDQKFAFLNPLKKLILVTGHRRENFGKGFEGICSALQNISEDRNLQIVFPVHLNPQVQEPVKSLLAGRKNIFLIEPQDYLPFVYLMHRSDLILTDSGGVQEEAPSLGKPVLVMREVTERPEAVEAGTVRIVGTDSSKIVRECRRLICDESYYKKVSFAHNPYGDGRATERILMELIKKHRNPCFDVDDRREEFFAGRVLPNASQF